MSGESADLWRFAIWARTWASTLVGSWTASVPSTRIRFAILTADNGHTHTHWRQEVTESSTSNKGPEWKLPLHGRITYRHCRQPKLPNCLYSLNRIFGGWAADAGNATPTFLLQCAGDIEADDTDSGGGCAAWRVGGEAGWAPSGGLRSCACSRTGWGRHHNHHHTDSGIAMDCADRNRKTPHLGDWWDDLTTTTSNKDKRGDVQEAASEVRHDRITRSSSSLDGTGGV